MWPQNFFPPLFELLPCLRLTFHSMSNQFTAFGAYGQESVFGRGVKTPDPNGFSLSNPYLLRVTAPITWSFHVNFLLRKASPKRLTGTTVTALE